MYWKFVVPATDVTSTCELLFGQVEEEDEARPNIVLGALAPVYGLLGRL